MGTATVFHPTNPNKSFISYDEKQHSLIPINGNPEHIRPSHSHPIQLCQQLQHVPDTPESLPPEQRGQRGIFLHYNLPTFVPLGLSQATACDGLSFSVDYIRQHSNIEVYPLPFFEE